MNKMGLSLFVAFASVTPSLLLTAIPPVQAQSNFSCGPHLRTYVVSSANGEGKGIRCVKFTGNTTNSRSPQFVWYGEGNWGGNTYRHVGQAISTKGGIYTGYASDIYGNGEYFNGSFDGNLSLRVTGRNKQTITVTGAWNEEWRLVRSTSYQALPTPRTCGSYFDEYQVRDLDGKKRGSGLRCVLQVGMRETTWFGNGNWEGNTYSHLGTRSGRNYGADDLCGRNFGSICNTFRYGSFNLRPISGGFDVTGAWNETWFN